MIRYCMYEPGDAAHGEEQSGAGIVQCADGAVSGRDTCGAAPCPQQEAAVHARARTFIISSWPWAFRRARHW